MTAEILITLADDGKISVQCSGEAGTNKVTMLGLLELAKATMLAQQQAPPVNPGLLLARGSLPNNGMG